ncbi:amidohydrolase family protein [uncultured Aquimarina sp.]|uniref:amidohydrolase n=1 Tax=uncultured Aquimarina sp. TaxID=575652 RepID=UPI0026182FCF|nr:amidohydrolase family protein [uncultured Aquimarina sp.]
MKTIASSLSMLAAIMLTVVSCTGEKKKNSLSDTNMAADYIFTNGKINTVDDNNSIAEAVVVKDGKIVHVGSTQKIQSLNLTDEKTKTIDLKGKMLMPGIIDGHFHAGVGVITEIGVNLLGTRTPEEAQTRIQDYIAKNPDKEVIFGFGLNMAGFTTKNSDGTFSGSPTKEFLDVINSEKPIFLISNSAHDALANSATLELIGINASTPDPHPGAHFYVRDHDGNPTGRLVEGSAFWSHLPALNIGTLEQLKNGLPTLLNKLPAQGITTIFDAGAPSIERNAFQVVSEMKDSGTLPVRYFGSHYITSREDAQNAVADMQALQKDFNSDMVRASSIKFSNDGITFMGPFIQFEEEEMQQYLGNLNDAGIDVMIHAINKSTINEALNAIESVTSEKSNSRFTITHNTFLQMADVPRFSQLGVIADIQLAHDFPMETPVAELFSSSAIVKISSDFPASGPVERATPFVSLEKGRAFGVDIQSLVRAITIESAYHLRMENKLGSIEVGKQADLIILDQDITKISTDSLPNTKVLFTMVNGVVKHSEL